MKKILFLYLGLLGLLLPLSTEASFGPFAGEALILIAAGFAVFIGLFPLILLSLWGSIRLFFYNPKRHAIGASRLLAYTLIVFGLLYTAIGLMILNFLGFYLDNLILLLSGLWGLLVGIFLRKKARNMPASNEARLN